MTTMRTPGHDEEMVTGYLISEGVIDSARDVMIELKNGGDGDVACLALRSGKPTDALEALRRVGISVSSCGVCGLVDVHGSEKKSVLGLPVESQHIEAMLRAMRRSQTIFHATGGVHAAALFDDPEADPLVVREDIGRHNAVDKAVGWLARQGALPRPLAMTTSGRASFEILQKAAFAGIGTVISVSAASTLAVDTAKHHGISLYGFVRAGKIVAYSVTP